MRSAFEWFTEYLDESGSISVGKAWQCPSHPDSYPSLSVSEDESGKVLIHCFGGCDWEEVMESLSLPAFALFRPNVWSPAKFFLQVEDKPDYAFFEWKQGSSTTRNDFWYKNGSSYTSEEFHNYTPDVRMRRRRYWDRPKQCLWQVKEGWRWVGRNGAITLSSLPLYREERVRWARLSGGLIVLCESESSVDALEAAGISATTWAGGASSPQKEALTRDLKGCNVLYIGDNDRAGLKCITELETFLPQVTNTWTVLLGNEGEDARDILLRGGLDSLNQS